MSGRFNRAMEKMGWRVPGEDEEVFEDQSDVAEVHQYPFSRSAAVEETPVVQQPVERRESVNEERQRIATVHPRSYSDVLAVGEAFRDNVPVIMNLTDMDDAEARRIVDFAAGLTFGVRGSIERVTTRVFLLSPEGVAVSKDRGVRR